MCQADPIGGTYVRCRCGCYIMRPRTHDDVPTGNVGRGVPRVIPRNLNWTRQLRCRRRRIRTRRRAAGSVILSGSCKLRDTLTQVHSGAGAPNEVSAIQILDVLLWDGISEALSCRPSMTAVVPAVEAGAAEICRGIVSTLTLLCLACSCRPLTRDTHLGAARCRQTERPASEPQFSDRYDTVNGLTSGPASALNSEPLPTDRSDVGSDLPCAL